MVIKSCVSFLKWSAVYKRSFSSMLINSFELDAYISFILWRPLVAELLFSAVIDRQ